MAKSLAFIGMVAFTSQRVMGANGGLPWHIPEDLKLFKKYTSGHPVVMGRKTFMSIGRPLPRRRNIVLSSDSAWLPPVGVEVVRSVEEVLTLEFAEPCVYVIGGAQIYQAFLPLMSSLLVSWVYRDYQGDTYFPEFQSQFPNFDVLEKFVEFELRRYYRRDE